MARVTEPFRTGEKAAITDGKVKVTFDYPADFADWLELNDPVDLGRWQWVKP